jgi:uroporphyrinogen-III synthase
VNASKNVPAHLPLRFYQVPFAEHCVYRTSTPLELLAFAAAEVVHQALLSGEAAAAALTLVFFSPSGVEALVPYVTKALAGFSSTRLRLVALGATTGEKAERRSSLSSFATRAHATPPYDRHH